MNQQIRSQLTSLGMNQEEISKHQERINGVLRHQHQIHLSVVDSCRLDNGGILPAKFLQSSDSPSGFASFVPAAGAASRYFAPLSPFMKALRTIDETAIATSRDELQDQNLPLWCLPDIVSQALSTDLSFCLKHRDEILAALAAPKALQTCLPSGESFLEVKERENAELSCVDARIYAVPPGQTARFQDAIPEAAENLHFIEQGLELSTLRFTETGEVFTDSSGKVSPVPAGTWHPDSAVS